MIYTVSAASRIIEIPYLIGYKTEVSSSKTVPPNLEKSYARQIKIFGIILEDKNPVLQQHFMTDLNIQGHSREGKPGL